MNDKFKIGEKVLVRGYGKEDGKFYNREYGYVICKDPYYKDYNIKFKDGSEDWFNKGSLYKIRKGKKKNANKKN